MKHNRKNDLITLAIILCLGLCGAGLYLNMKPEEHVSVPDKQVSSVVPAEEEIIDEGPENAAYYRDFFNENKSINNDYQGTLFFDSGLIVQPFVQSYDNSAYLRINWVDGSYDEGGSNFLDYECTPESQNLIIYGHYAYPSYDPTGTSRFTPLAQLANEENYEANKTVYLLLENEIREYEVAVVYYAQLINSDGVYYTRDDEMYNLTSFTDDYFNLYYSTIKAEQQYETGVECTNADRFLTLQTCVENRADLREIVLCRQVNTYPITDRCDFERRDLISSEKAG